MSGEKRDYLPFRTQPDQEVSRKHCPLVLTQRHFSRGLQKFTLVLQHLLFPFPLSQLGVLQFAPRAVLQLSSVHATTGLGERFVWSTGSRAAFRKPEQRLRCEREHTSTHVPVRGNSVLNKFMSISLKIKSDIQDTDSGTKRT